MSVPMQNASETLIAEGSAKINLGQKHYDSKYLPHPRIPATDIAPTIAHGTAVAALAASSLMCTLESNEPFKQSIHQFIAHR